MLRPNGIGDKNGCMDAGYGVIENAVEQLLVIRLDSFEQITKGFGLLFAYQVMCAENVGRSNSFDAEVPIAMDLANSVERCVNPAFGCIRRRRR